MALPPPCQQSLNGASKIPYLQGYNKVLQHSTKGDVREVHWEFYFHWLAMSPSPPKVLIETTWRAWTSAPTQESWGAFPLLHWDGVRRDLMKSQYFHHCRVLAKSPPLWCQWKPELPPLPSGKEELPHLEKRWRPREEPLYFYLTVPKQHSPPAFLCQSNLKKKKSN